MLQKLTVDSLYPVPSYPTWYTWVLLPWRFWLLWLFDRQTILILRLNVLCSMTLSRTQMSIMMISRINLVLKDIPKIDHERVIWHL